MIGDLIEVSVLSIDGRKVKLGITAPGSVPVFRKEVYLRVGDREGWSEQSDEALDRLTRPG